MGFAASSFDLRDRLRNLAMSEQLRILRLIDRGHAPLCALSLAERGQKCRCGMKASRPSKTSPARRAKRKASEWARRVTQRNRR